MAQVSSATRTSSNQAEMCAWAADSRTTGPGRQRPLDQSRSTPAAARRATPQRYKPALQFESTSHSVNSNRKFRFRFEVSLCLTAWNVYKRHAIFNIVT